MVLKKAAKTVCIFTMAMFVMTAFLFLVAPPAQAQTVEELISQGKTALESHNIAIANSLFQSALQIAPQHGEANLYYAGTRILNLVYAQELNTLLDRFNIDETGRDIYSWTADFNYDVDGRIVLPETTPTSGEIFAYLHDVVLPQINGALSNLDALEETANDPSSPISIVNAAMANYEIDSDIEIDYGDVALYRSVLHLLKAAIHIIDSFNFDVDIYAIVAKANNESLNIKADIIEAYPDLLKLSDSKLPEAKNAIIESINAFKTGLDFMRNEQDSQDNDLFSIDPESLADEHRLQVALTQVIDSLQGNVQKPFTIELSQFIHLGHFFDQPMNLRDFLFGQGAQTFLTDHLLYQVEWALTNISSLDKTFSQTLSTVDYPLDMDLEIDFGDVAMARSGMYALKSAIQTFCAYNMDVPFHEILDKMEKEQFTIKEDLLQAYPNFLNLFPDHRLSSAKSALREAIDAYNAGSSFIRSETDDQLNDIVTILTDDEISDDNEFRSFIGDLKNALNGKTVMDITNARSDMNQFALDLTRFYDNPIQNLQTVLPDFNSENQIIRNSLPDPTMGGIVPDFQNDDWNQILDLQPNPILQKLITVLQVCAGIHIANVMDAVEDVNIDGRVGLAEAIYYLEQLASQQ